MAVIWTSMIKDDVDAPCVLCHWPLDEHDAVKTKYGLAHETCAEQHFPYDPGDTRHPR